MYFFTGQMKQSHASHHVFHTLRNWLMMVPMRLAHPANHQRMTEEMPSKATLGEFCWSVTKISVVICDKNSSLVCICFLRWNRQEQETILIKGQLISKGPLGILNSPKKTNKKNQPTVL